MSNQILLANERIRIKPGICKLIKRSLKGAGRITVQKNTEVLPHDILGQYKITAGFNKINLARQLNVDPEEVPKFLKKAVGRPVFKGELLAFKSGLIGSTQIIVPTDSIFESLDRESGEATLKLLPKEGVLTSGVFGVVEDVDNGRGEVTLKCMTTEVYGVLGTGSEKEGFLNVISGAGDLVNASKITGANKGQILVCGSLVSQEIVKKALSLNVSGIICGGLNMLDYISMVTSLTPLKRVGTEVGISLIATEGFGLLPLGEDIQELLNKYNNRFCFINGNLDMLSLPSNDSNSIISCRKVGIPKSETVGVKSEVKISDIKYAMKVRLIWPPFMGAQGFVSAIDNTPTTVDSGISTFLLTIETKSRKLRVPYSNVEIIN